MAQKGKHLRKKSGASRKTAAIIAGVLAVILVIAVCVAVISGKKEDVPDEETVQPEEQVEEETKPESEPEQEQEPEPELEPEPETEPEPEAYDGPINPLTGEPVDEDVSSSRPYAVMLNNLKVATPQCGVASADIIFETLAEGGITRLMGVWQDISEEETLGSVRSSRPYYLDLAQSLDAIYIHAGGSDDAYLEMKSRGITHIDGVNGTGETFHRDAWRKANMGYEHSLMLDTGKLPAYVEKYGLRTEHNDGYACGMLFTDEPVPDGGGANNIEVTFSDYKNTTFELEEESGLYKVNQYGGKMTDSSDGEQVRAKNVLVLYASIKKIPGDDKGRLKMTLTGTGEGYFACGGGYEKIKWEKTSSSSEFEFTLEDGSQLEFGRGSSYICIIPIDSGNVSFS